MKIRIASQNPTKIAGVQRALEQFSFLKNATIESVRVPSNVAHQPIGLEETVQGAKNRAENAFQAGTFGVGLESGVLWLSKDQKHMADLMVCCVFDGKNHFFGLSSGFEIPARVIELILKKGLELQEAVHETGLTPKTTIGQEEGIVHVLTNKRVHRIQLVEQASLLAFCRLEQKQHYF